jgi:alpha-galactosidase/6-phospho-beta-glucosidase family protein
MSELLIWMEGFTAGVKLLDNLRLEFAGSNHAVWIKLFHASTYLGAEQVKLFDAYFAELKEAA